MHPLHSSIQLLEFLQRHFGLWAVFAVLFLENFGLPLPGEITLAYAGFHARHFVGGYGLGQMFLVAGLAAVLGQAGGYWLGWYASDWVRRVFHLLPGSNALAERYFRRFGPASVLLARFVAGLRTVVGPLAGMYRMPWRPFLACNIIGAAAWVFSIGTAGALLGVHWRRLARLLGRADLILLAVAVLIAGLLLHRLRAADGGDPAAISPE